MPSWPPTRPLAWSRPAEVTVGDERAADGPDRDGDPVGTGGLTPEEVAALDDVVDPSSLDVPADLDGALRRPAPGADATDGPGDTDRVTEPDPDPDDLSAVAPPPDDGASAPLPEIGMSDGTVPWRVLLAEAASILVAAGVATAEVDARRIVEEATGLEGAEMVVHLDEPATVNGV